MDSVEGCHEAVRIGRHSTHSASQQPIGFADGRDAGVQGARPMRAGGVVYTDALDGVSRLSGRGGVSRLVIAV
jgi:hypothetical protein